jgi:hypothetical protein
MVEDFAPKADSIIPPLLTFWQLWNGFQICLLSASKFTHLQFITHRYNVKGWIKAGADAGSKFEADPQLTYAITHHGHDKLVPKGTIVESIEDHITYRSTGSLMFLVNFLSGCNSDINTNIKTDNISRFVFWNI